VAAGRDEEGIADLLECQREEMGARASITLEWRANAAMALAARGDGAEARRLAEEQLALAREAGVPRPLGVALRTLGVLSEGEDGEGMLAEAVTVLEGSSARLEHARALVELGSSVRRAGRRRAAREHLRAGYELARSCGSAVVLERASEELAASGVRLRRPALASRDALTPSERRVAEMAATGMSNPEIVQALL
jgi:ATP/maltotriose-dependent transcriptional regulator MalT